MVLVLLYLGPTEGEQACGAWKFWLRVSSTRSLKWAFALEGDRDRMNNLTSDLNLWSRPFCIGGLLLADKLMSSAPGGAAWHCPLSLLLVGWCGACLVFSASVGVTSPLKHESQMCNVFGDVCEIVPIFSELHWEQRGVPHSMQALYNDPSWGPNSHRQQYHRFIMVFRVIGENKHRNNHVAGLIFGKVENRNFETGVPQ